MRFWGLLPEDHVVGKAAFIWKSINPGNKQKSIDKHPKGIMKKEIMKNMKANIAPLSCFRFILVIFVLISCNRSDEKGNESYVKTTLPAEISQVKIVVLTKMNFNHELISNGTVSASKKVDMRFESPEIIEEIYVKNGQRVIKGQKIAMLAQFKLKTALNQATDILEKSKLELQDVLISQGYVLRDSLKVPAAVMKIAKIKSNYQNSIIQYNLAQHNLKNSILYVNFDGVVANLFSKRYNMPPPTDPFCTIVGSSSLEADFTVLESELSLINKEDIVSISPFSINNYTITGKVDEINPIVDANGMVRVKARIFDSKHKLYDGMNVKVRIQRSVGKQLVIPKEALVIRNNKKVVFTAKNGRAIWNYVQAGVENSTGYVITEGLMEGDRVIYEGNLNLAHEAPIKIIR